MIKTEYHFGTRPWWVFMLLGIVLIAAALCTANITVSALLGVTGASCLWSIGELFEQKKRVERGWFPKKMKKEA